MLQRLVIKNYAIIDHLELLPDAHLNTVTGETGAGKSIILGALSLILGDRADTAVLINKQEKCVVEAHFDVSKNKTFEGLLTAEEIDHEPICIIRREISTAGKSRAFVNDTPVTLDVLNKLTSLLVDLQQQFGHLALEDDNFQMEVLDAIGKNNILKTEYKDLYRQYKSINKQLAEQKERQAQWQKEADYKQFLLDELMQADYKENEIEEAERQLKQMSHSERIIGVLQVGRTALDEGEQPMVNELKRIMQQLQTITDVMPEAEQVRARVASAQAELKDIAGELDRLEGSISLDGQLMQQLQERMDMGYKLLKKHAVNTTNELVALQEQLQNDLKATLDLNASIEKLTKEQEAIDKKLLQAAAKLSEQRKKIAPQIVKKINQLLALVGMPNAKFDIEIKERAPSLSGIDEVSFLLDANKSGRFQPVEKAASGGEMSRIMLCIKSLTAQAMQLPTLIFDEVDTGISGEAARQVAILLRDLSQYHQVICITHQPQVAAKGTRHFYIYKDATDKERITTKVRILKEDERILAIARMIGGEKPSEAAIQNARELVVM